jgi:cyclopropane-fatty-acyl-phospholipid synthase
MEPLFQKTYDALSPGGRAVHQFFCLNYAHDHAPQLAGQHFFPGSQLSAIDEVLAAARRAGFSIVADHAEESSQYKQTLRHWYERLCAHSASLEQLVGRPIVNRFKVFFPTAWKFFDEKEATLHRLVLAKSR